MTVLMPSILFQFSNSCDYSSCMDKILFFRSAIFMTQSLQPVESSAPTSDIIVTVKGGGGCDDTSLGDCKYSSGSSTELITRKFVVTSRDKVTSR